MDLERTTNGDTHVGFKLRRRNSLSKLIEEQMIATKNKHDESIHRYHSPQMSRKSYVKPPKPKKPHGLKLEIPDKRAKPLVDSGIHSWSGTPPKPRSSTPSTANSLETPLTATTPLSLTGTPTPKPTPSPKTHPDVIIDRPLEYKKTALVPPKRHITNVAPPAPNHSSHELKSEDDAGPKIKNSQKNVGNQVANESKHDKRTKSLPRDRGFHNKLNTSRSLDDSVLLELRQRDCSLSGRQHNSSADEQLTPKRKAPRPPHAKHVRRKSDTLMHTVNRPKPAITSKKHRRVTTDGGFSYHIKLSDADVKSTQSDELYNGDNGQSRHRYYTPQPTRKFNSFGVADTALTESGHYGVPPVERIAIKRHKSYHANNSQPKVSPERHKRGSLPVSPLASPIRDQLIQYSDGKSILKPPPLKSNRRTDLTAESISEEDEEDEVLEISDSGSFDGFVVVNTKPATKRAKHRSLPAQIKQRNKVTSVNTLGGVQHSKSTKVSRRKAKGHSVPLERIKSSNSKQESSSLSSSSGGRQGSPRRGDGLRETLLREAVHRQVSQQKSPTKLANPPKERAVNQNKAVVHHKKSDGQDETDFASKDDFVDSVSAYSANSPGNSPQRLRRRGSVSSIFSVPESLYSTASVFREIFMSERASHRKIKAVVGFAFGIILGIVLYMILDFALEYHWKHALIITSIATLFMALSLALTVRARCVAALMLPTLCTSKGRGAIYAIIIGLLLSGPIQNIYSNSEETSNSMSCSAEMAVNTSREIQQASQEVLNNYVRALARSVDKLHEATQTVSEVFRPIDQGVDVLQQLLSEAGETLRYAVTTCDDVLGSAYDFCNESLQKAYIDCKRALGGRVSKRSITLEEYVVHSRQKRQGISGACEILNVGEACKLLKLDVVCGFPGELNNFIENNLVNILMQLQRLHDMFVVDINFDVYWENRQRLNGSVKAVQEAVRQELRQSHDIIKQIFSVSDKILALSLVWLAIRSYNYYWKFCTKDKFDNFYITSAFKKMDEHRKSDRKQSLMPLKKTERRQYVDLGSLKLCKPERGLFKVGLAMVFMHATVALLIIGVDYGLYWLLKVIAEHGEFQYNYEAQGETNLDIGGTGIVSEFVRWMFVEGFNASNAFNFTIDTTECLPNPTQPNRNTAIAIGVLYVFTLLTVLCQAYMLRLRRFIANYYYPEREIERTLYLYNEILNRRNNLLRLLRRFMKQKKKEADHQNQISINAYLMRRYPCWGKLMRKLGCYNKYCQGCREKDKYGNFKHCSDRACECIYCAECAREAGSVCACNEFLDDYIYGTSESKC